MPTAGFVSSQFPYDFSTLVRDTPAFYYVVREIVVADAALVVADPGSHGTRKIYNRKLGKQELLEFMVCGESGFCGSDRAPHQMVSL